MKRSFLFALAVVVTGSLMAVVPAAALETWDAGAGYGSTNPSGVWSYGWKADSAGAFTPYPNFDGNSLGIGFMQWQDNAHSSGVDHYGWINHNPTAAPVTVPWGVYWDAMGIDMHPGIAGQHTTIRWTAPVEGLVDVNATFAIYSGWGAPGGFVSFNGVPYFGQFMLGNAVPGAEQQGSPDYPYAASYHGQFYVLVGDTIDLEVNYGPDSSWGGDATGVTFVVSEVVPEPSSLVALGMGALGMGGLLRRKSR